MIAAVVVCGLTVSTGFTLTNFSQNQTLETRDWTDFCDGWNDGYCQGWKDVKGPFSICPITPPCPIPGIGQETYRGGYNAGFKAGMRAAENSY